MNASIRRFLACVLALFCVLPLSSCKKTNDNNPLSSGSYDESGNYQPSIPDRSKQLAELEERNSDAVSWLMVPNTKIDEGVVQAGDNEYYLRRNMYGKYSYEGCYYLDYECLPGEDDLFSRNSIIYGHNLGTPMGVKDDSNGAKFAQLLKFAEESFASQTPYIYLTTNNGAHVFEIFAVFYCEADLDPIPYHYADYSDENFNDLMHDVQERSEYIYETQPGIGDNILTLSTCTYKYGTYSQNPNQRFVVMGRLMQEGDQYFETAKFEKNPNPKPPNF